MGKLISKVFGGREARLLMVGLDGAGKTTVLYRLKLGQPGGPTIPTVGFCVETFSYKKVRFTVWDIGGQDKLRPLWRHYYTGSEGLVWVVDSSDRDRLGESRHELHRVLRDREMRQVVVLVLANKQDLTGALKATELTEELGLTRLSDRNWHVQPVCALTGDGLHEGLTWLRDNLSSPTTLLNKGVQ